MLAPDEIAARSRAGARLAENRIPGASVSPTPHGRVPQAEHQGQAVPRTIGYRTGPGRSDAERKNLIEGLPINVMGWA
jgi:hypothetical protein